jgi:outer membrane protein OmpA-like peptidoglycan-associated protein
MGVAVAVVVLLAAVYWAAKPAHESVTVLPAPDGHIGTVVVQRGKEQQVLNQAYATSRSGEDAVVQLSPDKVQQEFGSTLKALPAAPTVFMLYFITGTDELTDESKADLDRILSALKERPVPDVAVIGHTDTVGDLKGNDMLSLLRAETVKGFLVSIGIPAERIHTAGRGKREPIVETGDNVEEPKNRRVEIDVR